MARNKTVDEIEELMDEPMVNGRPLPGAPEDMDVTQIVRNASAPISVYDLRSGVESKVNTYGSRKVIEDMLAKTDNDPQSPYYGKRVFTLRSPKETPDKFYNLAVAGKTPCMLNPEHPRYAEFKAMGFGTCRRNDLPNEQEAEAHAKSAHLRAYPRIKELDAARKAEQEAERLNKTLETLAALAGAKG